MIKKSKKKIFPYGRKKTIFELTFVKSKQLEGHYHISKIEIGWIIKNWNAFGKTDQTMVFNFFNSIKHDFKT